MYKKHCCIFFTEWAQDHTNSKKMKMHVSLLVTVQFWLLVSEIAHISNMPKVESPNSATNNM